MQLNIHFPAIHGDRGLSSPSSGSSSLAGVEDPQQLKKKKKKARNFLHVPNPYLSCSLHKRPLLLAALPEAGQRDGLVLSQTIFLSLRRLEARSPQKPPHPCFSSRRRSAASSPRRQPQPAIGILSPKEGAGKGEKGRMEAGREKQRPGSHTSPGRS